MQPLMIIAVLAYLLSEYWHWLLTILVCWLLWYLVDKLICWHRNNSTNPVSKTPRQTNRSVSTSRLPGNPAQPIDQQPTITPHTTSFPRPSRIFVRPNRVTSTPLGPTDNRELTAIPAPSERPDKQAFLATQAQMLTAAAERAEFRRAAAREEYLYSKWRHQQPREWLARVSPRDQRLVFLLDHVKRQDASLPVSFLAVASLTGRNFRATERVRDDPWRRHPRNRLAPNSEAAKTINCPCNGCNDKCFRCFGSGSYTVH